MRKSNLTLMFPIALILSACDSGGGSSSNQIATGDHCNSVFYQELIGSYSGVLRSDMGVTSRPCEWQLSLAITGEHTGGTCKVSGEVSSTATKLDDAENVRYSCMSLNETVDLTPAVIPTFEELTSPDYPVVLSVSPRRSLDVETDGLINSWPMSTENAQFSPSVITLENGPLQKGLGL